MATRQLDLPKAAEVKDLAGGLLTVIARAASDPNTDVEKLERLLAMQERVLEREAIQAFNAAMLAAQAEIRPIVSNKKNTETKSQYADLEQVSDGMDPIIHSHGFALSFGTATSELPSHYRVTCAASHVGGHTRDYYADVPIDNTGPKGTQNKTNTHGFGSALTYGRRYLKLLIFDVKTRDDDGNDAGRGQTLTERQIGDLTALIEDVGANKGRFLKYLRENGCRCGDTIESIPAKDYSNVVAALEARRAAK